MAHIQRTWQPRRAWTEAAQRVPLRTGAALEILKKVLPASEYDRMESEWRNGQREIRLEDGCIITCLTPIAAA
jgi:hypothetical protein